MLFASTAPFLLSVAAEGADDASTQPTYNAGGVIIGDLDEFNPSDGSEYLFIHEDEPVVSATQFMRQAWIDEGRPGVEHMVIEPSMGRSGARACTPHVVGDTLTVPISGGSISAYVAKTTNTVAFIVQSGRTLSSTVLNNLASTWDSTIYPTMTTYYGKDYQDGRGSLLPMWTTTVRSKSSSTTSMAPTTPAATLHLPFPRLGSRSSSTSPTSPSLGVNPSSPTSLSTCFTTLDPYENLWIDEGNADVAIYLCFGADSTLTGHVNAWTGAPSNRCAGGTNASPITAPATCSRCTSLNTLVGVQPSANWCRIPQRVAEASKTSPSHRRPARSVCWAERWEKFLRTSASLQRLIPTRAFTDTPTSTSTLCAPAVLFAALQPTDINSDWSTPWSSTGNTLEGWGIRSFKFTPGGASPAPLTLRLTADKSQFDGVVVSKAVSDGLWSVTDLDFVNNVATGLVPGFGNLTDEVWVITWYASTVADCDYTSCGPSYPEGIVDIEAARITSPATLSLNNTVLSDRDGDGSDDTVQINYGVLSNAFFEDLDVEVRVRDSSGQIVDTITDRIAAGGGVSVDSQVHFTAPLGDQYAFEMVMSDMLGDVVDTLQTSPQQLSNMKPVANGSVSLTDVQTWENIQFLGAGFDAWGLSPTNNSLPYLDPPTAYAWVFGDNGSSNLKSPLRSYTEVGSYNATLRVMDRGGTWSETQVHPINVTDQTEPVPVITVNNVVIENNLTLLTGQRILFSAGRTADNVPIDHLDFQWNWGDGTQSGGKGAYAQQHEWDDIDGESEQFNLTLSVSDGINVGTKVIQVNINNRVRLVQIYAETLTTMTYTSLVLPDVFVDDDGEILTYDWSFPDGVRVGTGTPTRNDDFSTVSSSAANPIVAWDVPGNKTVSLTVTDDDGSQATALLSVVVLNQMPVATFDVRTLSALGSREIDFREEDGQVDTAYVFDGLDSMDPDGSVGDSTDIAVWNWTFSDGTFGDRPQVTCTPSRPRCSHRFAGGDRRTRQESFARTITVRIANPVPIIQVRILDGYIGDEPITTSTPFPEGSVPDSWSHTFNEDGSVVTAPERMLYFDSAGTRDGDRQFEGKYVPFETESPDWNGLVQYTWDFGDATPLVHEASPWHAYTLPGTYTVSLTVRDGFGTGDVTRETFTVVVDHPPEAREIYIPENMFVGSSISFDADVFDTEAGSDMEIYRDFDVNDGSITDRNQTILTQLTVRWDFDIETDENENGDPADDWEEPTPGSSVRAINTWDATGFYTILIEVCDGMNQCDTLTEDIEIVPEPDGPPSLSDFSADEWKSWLADAGSELATFIALIVVALILGWLVMLTIGA